MIWVALILMGVAGACIWSTCYCVNTIARTLEFTRREHDTCHRHTDEVAKAVASTIGKQVLLAAANKWDSVDEQMNIKIMAREKWEPDGPSVPAIWLRHMAAELDRSL